jgi:hypothetical protein
VHLGESFPAGLRILPGRISQAIGVSASGRVATTPP